MLPDPQELLDKVVVSGLGEVLGRVVGVDHRPTGEPKHLLFLEDDGHLRRVRLEHVRTVGARVVELKGPREGFHITKLSQPQEAGRVTGEARFASEA